MQIFAHLIIDGYSFLQTMPVGLEESRNRWNIDIQWEILSRAPNFLVAILCKSQTGDIRLLGSVSIQNGEVMNTLESNQLFVRQLNKVNPDGPSLEFGAIFTSSNPTCMDLSGFSMVTTADNQITGLRSDQITKHLQRIYYAMMAQENIDLLQLRVMHERILLFPCPSKSRAHFLDSLGGISLDCYRSLGTVDHLNQAAKCYSDAVRNDPSSADYLSALGLVLSDCFIRFRRLPDINEAISAFEAALTHPSANKCELLSELGNCLYKTCLRFAPA
ncbi:hypothetical protein B0H19DRAFT_1193577 [Mycena capillaripes]|nr:hypothetical protein B0H19DRAFT_1193577 [Mycena capillaripes]